MFKIIYENLSKTTPIIHAITNYVTVNDCANIILASKASPIMSDEIEDIEDILKFSQCLVINIGTLNKRTVESMIYAGKIANKLKISVVLDPVGAGATEFRNETVKKLLNEVQFSVIKGNASELKFLASNINNTSGVDVAEADIINDNNLESNIKLFKRLSNQTKSVIVSTGVIDIITDGNNTYIVKNGSEMMSGITGTGCMLGCVIACYIASNKNHLLKATTFAVGAMGLAGERAEQNCDGNGSYKVALIDAMSTLNYQTLKEGVKVEIF